MVETAVLERHTKAVPAYFKAITDGSAPDGTFDAIVAVYNNVDLGGDRIIPGAFEKSIAQWKASGDPVPVIFSHQWDDLNAHVGTVDPANLKELFPGDPELPPELKALGGLLAKGAQMDLSAPGEAGAFATNLWQKMKSRAIKEFSFAYDIGAARPTKDAMDLIELDLIEIGPTLKGMNPSTALLGTKAARKAIAGMSDVEALDFLDSLVTPPPPRKAVKTERQAEVKRLPMGSRPEGAIEDTLDAIGASARVWAGLKYGPELYACHLEGTFLDQGKALITAERWSDPYGEGPLWELSYELDDAGATITDGKAVEVTVTLNSTDPAAAKRRAKQFLDAGHDRKMALWLTFCDDAGFGDYGTDDTTGSTDSDDDPGALAQGIDAILDSLSDALASGDVGQAAALLTGAESACDELLEVLGVVDADEVSTGTASSSSYAHSSKRGQARGAEQAKGEEPSAAASPIGVLLEIEELETIS